MSEKVNDRMFVFFDTNVFDKANYNFDEGSFYPSLLEWRKNFPNLNVLVFPILYAELVSHIKNKVGDVYEKLESLRSQIRRCFGDCSDFFFNEVDTQDDAVNRFIGNLNEFLLNFCDEKSFQLDSEEFSYGLLEVLGDYFNQNPPFGGKKKQEFKDAFLIQNLRGVVMKPENKESEFVVVSADEGFRMALEHKIPRVQCFDKYEDFFNFLSEKHEKYELFRSYAFNGEVFVSLSSYLLDEFFPDVESRVATNGDNSVDFLPRVGKNEKINMLRIDGENAVISASVQCSLSVRRRENGSSSDSGSFRFRTRVDVPFIVKLKQEGDEVKIQSYELDSDNFDYFSFVHRIALRYCNLFKFDPYDFEPSLIPNVSEFTIICSSCGEKSSFEAPLSSDFEVQFSEERNMGPSVEHVYDFQEECSSWSCSNEFEGKIVVTEYPYMSVDNVEVECCNGRYDDSLWYSYG